MISTKGRYSIRILLDLAEHRSGGYIPMKEVAARQNISLKYIEKLMPALKTAGFIERASTASAAATAWPGSRKRAPCGTSCSAPRGTWPR